MCLPFSLLRISVCLCFLDLCSAHICAGQSVAQKEDWGALTLMDLLWSVLKHGNLSLLNCTLQCTVGGLLYHQKALQCSALACSITIMGRNIKGRNYQPLPPPQLWCFPKYLLLGVNAINTVFGHKCKLYLVTSKIAGLDCGVQLFAL